MMTCLDLSANTHHSFPESDTKHFFWDLGNPILGKVCHEFIQTIDENISHVEHLVKCNLQVCYPALFDVIQSFPLSYLSRHHHKSLQTTPTSIQN